MAVKRIKIRKLHWTQKVEKLRRIVLSGPAIEDPDPLTLKLLELWRDHTHGKITDDQYMSITSEMGPPQGIAGFIWEPYSDERGDRELLYGWDIHATLFGIREQPYWLVRARHERSGEPPEASEKILNKAIQLLGCHDTHRDLIQSFPDEGDRVVMFWSWFHTGPLMEIHLHPATHDMKTVDEGTPLPTGWERMGRISRHTPPAER